jgi:L-fuconolactonase
MRSGERTAPVPGAVDAHHHLWDPAARDYPWMSGEALAPIRRRYDLDDLRQHAEANGVTRTVLVQALETEEETRDLLRLAASSDGLVAGVVGWVDLRAPDVADRLAALRSLPGGERLVGIRHLAQDEDDPQWLIRPDVLRGIAAVGAAGLRYDIVVRQAQWPAALAMARALEGVPLVVDHAGKPPIGDGDLRDWRGWIGDVAALATVRVKLSGLVTEADWQRWTADGLRCVSEPLLDLFGASRVMLGSDWPVCELAGSYERVWAAGLSLLDGATPAERHAVTAGTAAAFYGLPAEPAG